MILLYNGSFVFHIYFNNYCRFREAAVAINELPVEKLPLLLNRIIEKLHLRVSCERLMNTSYQFHWFVLACFSFSMYVSISISLLQGEKLFTNAEEKKLQTLFDLNEATLSLILNSCCYIFEQVIKEDVYTCRFSITTNVSLSRLLFQELVLSH